jgi:hypothetical protein
MGIRAATVENVRPGDVLDVVLLRDGELRSIVCQTEKQETVGALSAFPGLAQLIGCMEFGWQYAALVERASGRSCTVFVSRKNR